MTNPATSSRRDWRARNWWALLLRGLFAVLFGLIALFLPGTAGFSERDPHRMMHMRNLDEGLI